MKNTASISFMQATSGICWQSEEIPAGRQLRRLSCSWKTAWVCYGFCEKRCEKNWQPWLEDDRERRVTIATGELAAPILEELGQEIQAKYPKLDLQVKADRKMNFSAERLPWPAF